MLFVTKAGYGTGSVTSSPAGITCGADCKDGFPLNSLVTLTAVPDTNAAFAGWSGGGCSGINPCTIVMNADTTVTATFNVSVDIYGGWNEEECTNYLYAPSCLASEPTAIDTCDGNVDWEYTCPAGVSKTCRDVQAYYFYNYGSPVRVYHSWEHRTVTCVP
jgi:hypothetical protein